MEPLSAAHRDRTIAVSFRFTVREMLALVAVGGGWVQAWGRAEALFWVLIASLVLGIGRGAADWHKCWESRWNVGFENFALTALGGYAATLAVSISMGLFGG